MMSSLGKRVTFLTLAAGLTLAAPFLSATSLILPTEAIADSGRLTAVEFQKKYPGIDISGYLPDEEGYYITYNHINLTYYFGPVEDYQEALHWKAKLEGIVAEVVSLRPSLEKSKIYLYLFSYAMFENQEGEETGDKEGIGVVEETIRVVGDGEGSAHMEKDETEGGSDKIIVAGESESLSGLEAEKQSGSPQGKQSGLSEQKRDSPPGSDQSSDQGGNSGSSSSPSDGGKNRANSFWDLLRSIMGL